MLSGKARQRLVRPELCIERLFTWLDLNGGYAAPDIELISLDFTPMSVRLENAVIGRGHAEVCSAWKLEKEQNP